MVWVDVAVVDRCAQSVDNELLDFGNVCESASVTSFILTLQLGTTAEKTCSLQVEVEIGQHADVHVLPLLLGIVNLEAELRGLVMRKPTFTHGSCNRHQLHSNLHR